MCECNVEFGNGQPVIGQVVRIAFSNLRGPDNAIVNPLPADLKLQMQVNDGAVTDIGSPTQTGPGAGYFLYAITATGKHEFVLTSSSTGLIASGSFQAFAAPF